MVIVTRVIPPDPSLGQTTCTQRVITSRESQRELAEWQFKMTKSNNNMLARAWWRWVPGVEIRVKWPQGWVVLNEMPDGSKTSAFSADPHDHYGPWMEQHVGKRGIDWHWRLSQEGPYTSRVHIKIRNKHAKWATIAAMQWA